MNVAKTTKRAQTAEGRANRQRIMKEYRESGKMAESEARYWRSPKGRANQKRENGKMSRQLLHRMSHLINDPTLESATLQERTEFSSNQDVKDHLESTFDLSWMSWKNHGRLKPGAGPKSVWHIGHRIPCKVYDFSNPEDAKRCFSKANIFAQCAHENISLNDKLPPKDVLESLRAVWPVSWD